jgi:hypothetical protein
VPVFAQFSSGDVVAGGFIIGDSGVTGFVDIFPGGTAPRQSLSPGSTDVFSLAFDRAGRLLGGATSHVRTYARAGTETTLGAIIPGGPAFVEGIAVDAAGNIYVTRGASVHRLNPANVYDAEYVLPVTSRMRIDLGRDQCTLYVAELDGHRIRRHNVCTDTALPDLAAVTESAYDLRVLSNGSVLVALDTGITLFSSTGVVERSYTLPVAGPYRALALDPDMHSFWVATSAGVLKVDMNSGNIVGGPLVGRLPTNSLTVVGEPRAALLGLDVPTLDVLALFALGGILAFLAIGRLR